MKLVLIFIFITPLLLFSQSGNPVISATIGNCDTLFVQKDTSIVLFPDVEAEFPGGPVEMKKYIVENIQYPKIEFETIPDGRIFIEFIVNTDGSIEQVKVRKEGIKELDDAYIELIKNMPNWIPAEVDGVSVRSRAFLPFRIRFE